MELQPFGKSGHDLLENSRRSNDLYIHFMKHLGKRFEEFFILVHYTFKHEPNMFILKPWLWLAVFS